MSCLKKFKSMPTNDQLYGVYDCLISMASNGEPIEAILEKSAAFVKQGLAYVNSDGKVFTAGPTPPDFKEKLRFHPIQELCRLFDVIEISEEERKTAYIVLQDKNSKIFELIHPIKLAVQVHFNVKNKSSERRQRYVEKFFNNFMRGVMNADKLALEFKTIGVDFSGGIQVLAGSVGALAKISELEEEQGRAFFAKLDLRLSNFAKNYISYIKNNDFLAFVSPPSSSDLVLLSKNIIEISTHVAIRHFNNEKPSYVRLGLGSARSDFCQVAESYNEAVQTLHISSVTGSDNFVSLWNDLGSYKLICKISTSNDAMIFCKETLKGIAFLDSNEKNELLETLILLERNNWNLREVSRKMFYHHNTIKCRYQKIQETLGKDLVNSDTRFNISLALRILQSLPLSAPAKRR